MYGGDGHDRMVGGDGLTGAVNIIGNGGDDIIYGGNNMTAGGQYLYGDTPANYDDF